MHCHVNSEAAPQDAAVQGHKGWGCALGVTRSTMACCEAFDGTALRATLLPQPTAQREHPMSCQYTNTRRPLSIGALRIKCTCKNTHHPNYAAHHAVHHCAGRRWPCLWCVSWTELWPTGLLLLRRAVGGVALTVDGHFRAVGIATIPQAAPRVALSHIAASHITQQTCYNLCEAVGLADTVVCFQTLTSPLNDGMVILMLDIQPQPAVTFVPSSRSCSRDCLIPGPVVSAPVLTRAPPGRVGTSSILYSKGSHVGACTCCVRIGNHTQAVGLGCSTLTL